MRYWDIKDVQICRRCLVLRQWSIFHSHYTARRWSDLRGSMEKDTATGTREWSRHKDIMRCCNIMVPKNPPSPSTPTVEGRELFPAPSDGERGVVKGDGAESADRHWEGVAAGRGHPPPIWTPYPAVVLHVQQGAMRSHSRSLTHTALVMMMSLWEPASPPPTSGVMLFKSR